MKKRIIRLGEHCTIVGSTGSGKTFLSRIFAAKEENVAIHDTKGMYSWPETNYAVATRLDELNKLQHEHNHIIYRPVFQELEMEYYEKFYRWVYERRQNVVVVDEAMQICPNPQKLPTFLKGIMTRGRERQTSAWILTQRPKSIPMVLLSESYHYFIFRLNLKDDRKVLADITGQNEFLEAPGKYQFWYWNIEMDKPSLCILK